MYVQTSRHSQRGAATLLLALVLMMSITIVTLSVARTQIVEQQIAANDSWKTRLSLQAESSLAKGLDHLGRALESLSWTLEPGGNSRIARLHSPGDRPGIRTEIVFRRAPDTSNFVSVQANARSNNSSSPQSQVSVYVRPLSILTPLAETSPPFVLNGCLEGSPSSFHIRPLNADSDQAGEAAWRSKRSPCRSADAVDIHGGRVVERSMEYDLWPLIFSIDRSAFDALAADEQARPSSLRRYRVVQDSDLVSGRWNQSVGSTTDPVVLYFPSQLGCPEFSSGVRIFGVVFIDAGCPEPFARTKLEVFGTLIINGNLNIRAANLHLNHIQMADRLRTRLHFPTLRCVRVPGTWKDF